MYTGKVVSSVDTLGLRAGELVEVRSEAEILATLDSNAELDSLPFMPEMLQFCGQRFTVYKAAHKLCDTIQYSGMRRMKDAVHLAGVRCDGQAHGGCQTGCLVYWKEAWLKRVAPVEGDELRMKQESANPSQRLPVLHAATRKEPGPDGEDSFSCQATELLRAAPELLPFRDIGQYIQDVKSGNVSIMATIRAFFIGLFNRLQAYGKRVLPKKLWFREGLRWGFLKGTANTKTPSVEIGLQPGERVRIKSREEILKTVDKDLRNRGLPFDQDMTIHCGREARVLRRVDRVIDEKTGRMLHLKNPCVILDEVVCSGSYNASCPRAFYSFWREIWLERVDETLTSRPSSEGSAMGRVERDRGRGRTMGDPTGLPAPQGQCK